MGGGHLRRLLPLLIKNTNKKAKIILIDDCSSDKEIVALINKYKDDRVTIFHNTENMGFVRTVNFAMRHVNTQFAVLLNTDVTVPPEWLERILNPFNEFDQIASCTPFTNSGVAFSFPVFGKDNQLHFSLSEIDDAFRRLCSLSDGLDEIFSGTGFCMAINMQCWHEIGELDQNAFAKGYGEENDWCFRALLKGWKHLLVPNLFVSHYHGGSFSDLEKKKLVREHLDILKKRYPDIMNDSVPKFFSLEPWKRYRYLAALFLSSKNLHLIVDILPDAGDVSGAIDYSNYLRRSLEADNKQVIYLFYKRYTDNWYASPVSVDENMLIPIEEFSDIRTLFSCVSVRKIIVNNLAFLLNPERVIDVIYRLKEIYNIELEYRFHDYLSICPSFFLLNDSCMPCDPKGVDVCKSCLQKNRYRTIDRNGIVAWRKLFEKLFSITDNIVFFSEYSLNMATRVYPFIFEKSQVKEHLPLFSSNYSRYKKPENKPITLAFVGTFISEKGSEKYIELYNLFKKRGINARFLVIGANWKKLPVGIEYIGKYKRDKLGEILSRLNVSAVIYPSLNSETFSYTVQEMMILNVPFVVFNLGAPPERIKKYNYPLAEIAKSFSVDDLFEATAGLLYKVYNIDITS